MVLETLSNKGPYPKWFMKSSPHYSFCQVHQRRPLDDDKFCMDSFFHVEASCPKTVGYQKGLRKVWQSLQYIPSLPPISNVPL